MFCNFFLLMYKKINKCNSVEKTYYQKNRDVVLIEQKIMKLIKKDQEIKQEINTEIDLKKKKTKKENMEETDIIKCLKKRNKN